MREKSVMQWAKKWYTVSDGHWFFKIKIFIREREHWMN